MFDDRAICVHIPAVAKARQVGDRRLIDVIASSEQVDGEGDVILQSALLDSADVFVATGHLDVDHLSELGTQLGIENPSSYIIGNPTAVSDVGNGRTGVEAELQRNRVHADEVWSGLTAEPPIRWQASIFGYPTEDGIIDCRTAKTKNAYGATRFIVSKLRWQSLALTRHPINSGTGVSVATSKAYCAIVKSRMDGLALPARLGDILPPRSRDELLQHYENHISKGKCAACDGMGKSIMAFRVHFEKCCGMSHHEADVNALALSVLLQRRGTR